MKLVRFGRFGQERPGIIDASGRIRDASRFVQDWTGSFLHTDFLAEFSRIDLTELPEAEEGVRLGCPVASAGKVICVGLNYADHASETGFERPEEPLIFFKSPTALSGPFDPIVIPPTAAKVDWEVELAVIMGDRARNVTVEEALSFVAGFAVGNDITDRGWQFDRGGQWSKGKSADTFAPLGPWLVTPDELPPNLDLRIWLCKNHEPRQDSRTSKLLFSIPEIIAHLSEFMTLLPGDVVMSGTPRGVAYNKAMPDYLKATDVITCGIQGLGSQHCTVEAELPKKINAESGAPQ